MRETVEPADLIANGLWNHFTGRKKYRIKCGKCGYAYADKVYFSTGDDAQSICPSCGSVNKWSHREFERFYNKWRATLE